MHDHDQAGSAPAPPRPSGQELASFDRRGGRDTPDTRLRVALDEFNGHAYISVRLFERDRFGRGWWPVRGKGVSIRLAEAQGVAEALEQAVRLASRPASGPPQREFCAIRPRKNPPPRRDPGARRSEAPGARLPMGDDDLPPARGYSGSFDEFD